MQEISALMAKVGNEIAQAKDAIEADGWMQLHSLLTRVDDNMTNGRMMGAYGTAVRYLVNGFANLAYAFYQKVVSLLRADPQIEPRQIPFWQYRIIERLCNEWETLTPLFSPIKEPHFTILNALIDEAKPRGQRMEGDLLITIPYVGRRFELVTFAYAPNILVIGVPIETLDTPWNWPIIWHEMAGQVVRQLEADIENQFLEDLPAGIWDAWHVKYVARQIADKTEWLKSVDRVGWLAELIEDAFSVLTLGPTMVKTLRRVLQQHYESDDEIRDKRHPTPRLRFDMAGALLLEMGFALDGLNLVEEDCTVLRPVAGMIRRLLVGDERQDGFLAREQAFTMAMQAAVNASDMKRSSKLPPVQNSYRSLITAARLGLESAPATAMEILARAKNVVKQSYEPTEALAAVNLEDEYFDGLVALNEGENWTDLLYRPFSETDLASPYWHTHNDGEAVTVTFWNRSHGRHSWTHSTH